MAPTPRSEVTPTTEEVVGHAASGNLSPVFPDAATFHRWLAEREAATIEHLATLFAETHKPGRVWRSDVYKWLRARAAEMRIP